VYHLGCGLHFDVREGHTARVYGKAGLRVHVLVATFDFRQSCICLGSYLSVRRIDKNTSSPTLVRHCLGRRRGDLAVLFRVLSWLSLPSCLQLSQNILGQIYRYKDNDE